MALFDNKTRYDSTKSHLAPYACVDRRGRSVLALPMVEPRPFLAVGRFVRTEGQRLDHLAGGLVSDPNGFWRIAEMNDAVLPDALDEVEMLKIPAPNR